MAWLKITLVAVSLALDVFAVSVGVGMRGVAASLKWRIGIAFACAEIVMNLVGAGIGSVVGRFIGGAAAYLGFIALVALGCYMIIESRREASSGHSVDMTRGLGLLIASMSISLDSLGIGFSILFIGVPLYSALAIIGVASILSTFAGMWLGRFLGRRVEEGAELWSGVVLALTGLFFIAQRIFGWGI